MLKSLILAVTLALTMSPGRADDQNPKKEQGIQAEVRGILHFENGRGYFIAVKTAGKTQPEMRVWLRAPEDKALVRQLQGLSGKEVIANGKLMQMPANVRASIPPLGIYLRYGFTIENAGAK
jgi:hypothetical protein